MACYPIKYTFDSGELGREGDCEYQQVCAPTIQLPSNRFNSGPQPLSFRTTILTNISKEEPYANIAATTEHFESGIISV